ncbi:transcription factor HES-4-A-like [Watersipora subatra]|uniref:transcription factor HES-4-A-like n=1 Tax=Watersipora subatra TaxID=2589382 RepID=UPI00355C8637
MSHDSDCETKISLSKANRRIAKPIMEKKRRARINASLNELKTLLVEVLQKEGCRHSSKMEKADILEMAVRHLKNLQCQQPYSASGQIHTLRDSYPPAIPLEKFAASLPPDCLPPDMGKLMNQPKNDCNTKSMPNSPDSTTARTDTKRTILPAPKPINVKPHIVQNPMMTRTANGELAVVLPQHLLNQAGSNNSGLVVPLCALSSTQPLDRQSQPFMLSINVPIQQSPNSAFSQTQSSASSTSSPPPEVPASPSNPTSPTSPVWRPW